MNFTVANKPHFATFLKGLTQFCMIIYAFLMFSKFLIYMFYSSLIITFDGHGWALPCPRTCDCFLGILEQHFINLFNATSFTWFVRISFSNFYQSFCTFLCDEDIKKNFFNVYLQILRGTGILT